MRTIVPELAPAAAPLADSSSAKRKIVKKLVLKYSSFVPEAPLPGGSPSLAKRPATGLRAVGGPAGARKPTASGGKEGAATAGNTFGY
jgi:hypothetical protein